MTLSPDPTTVFCSELVAEAYRRAGAILVPSIRTDSVTPAMLQNNSLLAEIETPLRELSPEESVQAQTYLDRDAAYVGTPMHREMIAGGEAFKAVETAASALNVPKVSGVLFPAGNLHELIGVLQVTAGNAADQVASQLLIELEARKYFDLGRATLVPLIVELQGQLARVADGALNPAERATIVSDLRIDGFEATRDRYLQNRVACMSAYSAQNRKLWLRLAAMYQLYAEGLNYALDLASQIKGP